MNTLADILLAVALPGALAFPILYAVRSNWRAMRTGRSMMYLSISLAAVLALNFASIYFPDYYGRGTVRVVVYTAMIVSVYGQLRTLNRVQNKRPGYLTELPEKETHK